MAWLSPAESAHRDAGQFGHLDEGETEYSGGIEDGGVAGRQSIPGGLGKYAANSSSPLGPIDPGRASSPSGV